MNTSIDGIKAPARTEHEAWLRWLNRMQSDLAVLINSRTRIKVRYER